MERLRTFKKYSATSARTKEISVENQHLKEYLLSLQKENEDLKKTVKKMEDVIHEMSAIIEETSRVLR